MRMTLLSGLGCLLVTATCHADITAYFTSTRDPISASIERVDLADGVLNTLYQTSYTGPRPMSALPIGDSLYWTTYYPGRLMRSGLNGESPTILAEQGVSTTRHMQYRDGKIYWNNEALQTIYRSNLDGSGIETVVTGNTPDYTMWDFVIAGERIYWTQWTSRRIFATNLDGSGLQSFEIPGAGRLFSIETDGEQLFVTDSDTRNLLAVNLAMTSSRVLYTNSFGLTNLSYHDGRLYFGITTRPSGYITSIYSIPANGGTPTTEWAGATTGTLWQLTIVPSPAALPLLAIAGLISRRHRAAR